MCMCAKWGGNSGAPITVNELYHLRAILRQIKTLPHDELESCQSPRAIQSGGVGFHERER
jgi:hypothetical protein